MSALDPIIRLMLRTNDIWPFSRLNRLPYTAALAAFKAVIGRHPAVLAAYTRHGLARGDIIPGLSDIDLTVILADGMPAADEMAAVSCLFADYARLQAAFPNLGEMEILTEGEFRVWAGFGYRGKATGDWMHIRGRDLRAGARVGASPIERADEALMMYLDYLMLKARMPQSPIIDAKISRLSKKIALLCGAPDPDGTIDVAMSALDRACGQALSDEALPFDGVVISAGFERPTLTPDIAEYCALNDQVMDVAAVPDPAGHGSILFIIAEGGDAAKLIGDFPKPYGFLVGPRMFRYILTARFPSYHYLFSSLGASIRGKAEALAGRPPSLAQIRYATAFEAVRRAVLLRSYLAGSMMAEGIDYPLRYLMAKRLMEEGIYEIGDWLAIIGEHDKAAAAELERHYALGADPVQRYGYARDTMHAFICTALDI